jgi:ATP-dependent RNA helicase DHX57
MLRTRQKLPAFAAKDDFLRVLEKNRVVVVVGETGVSNRMSPARFVLTSFQVAAKPLSVRGSA